MSNALAIAAVTEVLRDMVFQGVRTELGSGRITAQPLDKAREEGDRTNQLNLFLYQTVPSKSWRNQDLSQRNGSGHVHPPLALHLYYLLTAYGQDDDDIRSQRLLGMAMRILQDYPSVDPAYIERVLITERVMVDSDLHQQVDRIRITPQPLSLDELSKLWTTFQTQYRISAAYEVSVVLLDSQQPKPVPMPVLSRGQPLAAADVNVDFDRWDQGILVLPELFPPYPTLLSMVLPSRFQPSIRLGDSLTLKGAYLSGQRVRVLFRHPKLAVMREATVNQISATEIDITIPNQPEQWPAGFYQVRVVVGQSDDAREDRTSNELSIAIAPTVDQIRAIRQNNDLDTGVRVDVDCRPFVWPNQQAVLILNVEAARLSLSDREIPALSRDSGTPPTDTLTFDVGQIPADFYQVRPRLRIDGVDSFIINYPNTPPSPTAPPPTLIPYISLEVPS